MNQITLTVLIIIGLGSCSCNTSGINFEYSSKRNRFIMDFTSKFFRLMKKSKTKVIRLPNLLSTPPLHQKMDDDQTDNRDFIPKQINYTFSFKTSIANSVDYNYIEVTTCNGDNYNVRTQLIKKFPFKKGLSEDDLLKLQVRKGSTNICLKVMDFEKMKVIARIMIPLHKEVYLTW